MAHVPASILDDLRSDLRNPPFPAVSTENEQVHLATVASILHVGIGWALHVSKFESLLALLADITRNDENARHEFASRHLLGNPKPHRSILDIALGIIGGCYLSTHSLENSSLRIIANCASADDSIRNHIYLSGGVESLVSLASRNRLYATRSLLGTVIYNVCSLADIDSESSTSSQILDADGLRQAPESTKNQSDAAKSIVHAPTHENMISGYARIARFEDHVIGVLLRLIPDTPEDRLSRLAAVIEAVSNLYWAQHSDWESTTENKSQLLFSIFGPDML